eukprot:XP_001696795.1 predicted protein [Chlamydomonas reinhardtii]
MACSSPLCIIYLLGLACFLRLADSRGLPGATAAGAERRRMQLTFPNYPPLPPDAPYPPGPAPTYPPTYSSATPPVTSETMAPPAGIISQPPPGPAAASLPPPAPAPDSPTPPPTNGTLAEAEGAGKSSKTGVIVAATVTPIVVLALVGVGVWWYLRRRGRTYTWKEKLGGAAGPGWRKFESYNAGAAKSARGATRASLGVVLGAPMVAAAGGKGGFDKANSGRAGAAGAMVGTVGGAGLRKAANDHPNAVDVRHNLLYDVRYDTDVGAGGERSRSGARGQAPRTSGSGATSGRQPGAAAGGGPGNRYPSAGRAARAQLDEESEQDSASEDDVGWGRRRQSPATAAAGARPQPGRSSRSSAGRPGLAGGAAARGGARGGALPPPPPASKGNGVFYRPDLAARGGADSDSDGEEQEGVGRAELALFGLLLLPRHADFTEPACWAPGPTLTSQVPGALTDKLPFCFTVSRSAYGPSCWSTSKVPNSACNK